MSELTRKLREMVTLQECWGQTVQEAVSALDSLSVENERLKAALKPFVRYYENSDPASPVPYNPLSPLFFTSAAEALRTSSGGVYQIPGKMKQKREELEIALAALDRAQEG